MDTDEHGESSPAPENTSPPNSHRSGAEEFGFTKKLLKHLGLHTMMDADCLVNVLRLPLDAMEDQEMTEMQVAFKKLDDKLKLQGDERSTEFFNRLSRGVLIIRKQLRNSEEQLKDIPTSARHGVHLTNDGKRLTQHAADFWIRRMRSDFEDSSEQKCRRDNDRSWGSSARQVEQRQGGRYNAYMNRTFGGQDCLKHFS